MSGTWDVKPLFLKEFARFPDDQKIAIATFTDLVEKHGLSDFSRFTGKISQSWSSLSPNDPVYQYAYSNDLWHYHIGIPAYLSQHPKFKTSDYVLHFQWKNWDCGGNHVTLVDCCFHYKHDGTFYMPPSQYLEPPK